MRPAAGSRAVIARGRHRLRETPTASPLDHASRSTAKCAQGAVGTWIAPWTIRGPRQECKLTLTQGSQQVFKFLNQDRDRDTDNKCYQSQDQGDSAYNKFSPLPLGYGDHDMFAGLKLSAKVNQIGKCKFSTASHRLSRLSCDDRDWAMLVSVRSYDAEEMCLYDLGTVTEGRDVGTVLSRALANPRTRYININIVRHGCLLTAAEKPRQHDGSKRHGYSRFQSPRRAA